MNNFKKATCREVRDMLVQMQKYGGAMIKPFVLYKLFCIGYSEEEQQNPGFRAKIRSFTDVFCAICNEYFLICYNDKHQRTEFFIPEERWEKYFYTQKQREMAIEYLENFGLLICGEKIFPDKDTPVRTYMINFDMLNACLKLAEELYEEERAKKRYL